MHRRHFLKQLSALAMLPSLSALAAVRAQTMGVVVHSYVNRWRSTIASQQYPGFRHAIDLLDHCHQLGARGVQVTVDRWSDDFTREVRDHREKLGLYLEGSVYLPEDEADIPRFRADIRAAREAGAGIVRTVCLRGRRYEHFQRREEFDKFAAQARHTLQQVEPIMRSLNVRLAVENHKDWRTEEFLRILKQLDSEWIGVNFDFGNNVALLEDPLEVLRGLGPWVITTHVKDMAVMPCDDGFLLSEVPLGSGILDLEAMAGLCRRHFPGIRFNLEMITRDPLLVPCLTEKYWATLPALPSRVLARTLHMVNSRKASALPCVSNLEGEERLAREEKNVLESLHYSQNALVWGKD